jgi:hypothetical protein
MLTYLAHQIYVVTSTYPSTGVRGEIVRGATRADIGVEKLGCMTSTGVVPLSPAEVAIVARKYTERAA